MIFKLELTEEIKVVVKLYNLKKRVLSIEFRPKVIYICLY